jgi:hypothetical protein
MSSENGVPGPTVDTIRTAIVTAIHHFPLQELTALVEGIDNANALLEPIADGSVAIAELQRAVQTGRESMAAARTTMTEAQDHLTQYLARIAAGSSADALPLPRHGDKISGHPPCSYVSREVGSGSDADTQLLRETPGVAFEIAMGIVRERNVYSAPRHIPLGELAMRDLACDTCSLAPDCRVKEYLTGFSYMEEIGVASREPQTVPWVITVGRMQRNRTVPPLPALANELREVLQEPDSGRAVRIDLQDVRESMGGITLDNTVKAAEYKGTDLPEINTFAAITADTRIAGVTMVTDTGQRFEFVDASKCIDFKGVQPSANEFAVLCGKFLGRIIETSHDNKPLIMTPDNKMQKTISSVPGGQLYEMRMSGKNRLYFTVRQPVQGEPIRIIFLGAHGGDADTQRDFINNALKRK